MVSLVELINNVEVLNEEDFGHADTDQKLQLLSNAVVETNSRFIKVNDASEGLDPRATHCEEKVNALTEENRQLRFEFDILKGLFTKMERENVNLRDRVTSLTALSMKNNIVIAGLKMMNQKKIPRQSSKTLSRIPWNLRWMTAKFSQQEELD